MASETPAGCDICRGAAILDPAAPPLQREVHEAFVARLRSSMTRPA